MESSLLLVKIYPADKELALKNMKRLDPKNPDLLAQ
jgi:hypothetical protein